MDIVLDTLFDNSHLPRVQNPGFTDSFGAADGTLDYTEDGKTWIRRSATGSGTALWVRNSWSAKLNSASPPSHALVDALVPDGVFTTTVRTAAADCVTVLRYVDNENYLYLQYSGSGSHYQLLKRVAGSSTGLASTAATAADGDVIEVTLSGSAIDVVLNSSPLTSVTCANFTDATMFGLSATAYTGRWESVSFVAS